MPSVIRLCCILIFLSAKTSHAIIVTLTKVGGKGRDLKTTLVDTLRASLDGYRNLFLLKFENLRSTRMRDVRMHWKESRIFLGKNSIAQIALGRTEAEEYKENLHLISQVCSILIKINLLYFLLSFSSIFASLRKLNLLSLCLSFSPPLYPHLSLSLHRGWKGSVDCYLPTETNGTF